MGKPLYGNPIRKGSTRFFGWLPAYVFAIGCFAAVVVLFAVATGHYVLGLSTLVVTLVVVLVFFIPLPTEDLTIAQQVVRRVRHATRRRAGETLFLNSHFSDRAPGELMGLPGYLHSINTVPMRDGTGKPVELLHHTQVDMGSVTLVCSPHGADMQPDKNVTGQIHAFGEWLGSFSREGSLRGASVTVDSVFESSRPLAESVLEKIDHVRAPEVSQQMVYEAAAALPARVASMTTYVTLGWRLSSIDADREGAYAEIISRLPKHRAALAAAGAGQVRAMTDADYGDMMYTAYNPHRHVEVAHELQEGVPAFRTFDGSGPEYMNADHKRVVLHDGVASMTAIMTVPDPSKITERSYQELFAPSHHFLRKRVTLFYRPIVATDQRKRIDAASRATTSENTSRKRYTAYEAKRQQQVGQAMSQMASGAKLHEWGLMVTVTFEPNEKAQRAAENELKALMGGMRWVFADFAADAAFHQTLPIGVFPWVYGDKLATLLSKKTNVLSREEGEKRKEGKGESA